jgi:hypothetical protein
VEDVLIAVRSLIARQPAATDKQESIGYVSQTDIERLSTYKGTIWPSMNESAIVPVYAAPLDKESSKPALPQGFTAKRVEGHGWIIDPPSGSRWIAYEGTPAGELIQALAASPAAPSVEQDERGAISAAFEAYEYQFRMNGEERNKYDFESGWKAARAAICPQDSAPSVEQDERGAVECRDLTDDDMDRLIVWLGEHDRDEIGHQGLCERIIGAFAARAASTSANVAQGAELVHLDDWWVDLFAKEMKSKLANAREKGRGGWQDCAPADLSNMLRDHVEKGDPRDVANFCMFLWALRSPICAAPPAQTALTDDRISEIIDEFDDCSWIDGELRIDCKDMMRLARALLAAAQSASGDTK